DKGQGYGMESHIIDGNNILEVYTKIKRIANSVRENPRPVLLEFKTFRMRGHEEASGTKYVPKELLLAWKKKDPLENYENFLFDEGILNSVSVNEIKKEIATVIEEDLKRAFGQNEIVTTEEVEIE